MASGLWSARKALFEAGEHVRAARKTKMDGGRAAGVSEAPKILDGPSGGDRYLYTLNLPSYEFDDAAIHAHKDPRRVRLIERHIHGGIGRGQPARASEGADDCMLMIPPIPLTTSMLEGW